MNEQIKEMRLNFKEAEDFFIKRLAFTVDPIELKELGEKEKIKIIDVRLKADYEIGHIPNAISIPEEELDKCLSELTKEETTIIYGYNYQCNLANKACLKLAQYGYPVMILMGGFKSWTEDFRFTTSKE